MQVIFLLVLLVVFEQQALAEQGKQSSEVNLKEFGLALMTAIDKSYAAPLLFKPASLGATSFYAA